MYLKLSNAFSRQVDGLYQRKFIFCGGEHRNSERHQEAFNVMLVKDKKMVMGNSSLRSAWPSES